MDQALFKDLYLFELDRRDKLSEGMNGLITALSLLGALIGFGLETYTSSLSDLGGALVVGLGSAGVAAYAVSLYHAMQFFHLPQDYRAIATSSELSEYYEVLLNFYQTETSPETSAEAEFEKYLRQVYSEATDVNANNNYYRGDRQKRAYAFLTYAVAFILLAFVAQHVTERLS
jgi:hypothetical protein